ncbi:AMP-binding protein [Sessilibacter corallicola]|uniref:AMP-binding protein n=1 Tax=Sessilibacter corallicola TaxID=2904075 RepID=UPI001E65067D|nr:AMP-binding protein [Sessilibacter corallicola]MCE2029231.1 AMP-binding protein [Sessilibacter corallicola]
MNDVNTIYQAVKKSSELHDAHTAFTLITKIKPNFSEKTYNYFEFFSNLKRAARLFKDLSENKSKVVVSTLLPNIPQHQIALWGAECIGIANPLNPLLSVEAITELLLKANSDIVLSVGPTPGINIWQKAQQAAANVREISGKEIKLLSVSVLPTAINVAMKLISKPLPKPLRPEMVLNDFDSLLLKYSDEELPSSWLNGPEDTVAYFHTGGTTGTPKLAKHSSKNQLESARRVCEGFELQAAETIVNGLPLFHVAGAIVNSLSALISGLNIILPTVKSFRDPNVIQAHWKIIEYYRVNISGGIPTSVASMLSVPLNGSDTSSLRIMSSGGAPIPENLYADIRALTGVELYCIYGMTETAGFISMANVSNPIVKGSAGVVAESSGIRINGSSGTTCGGEVLVKSESVFSGYLGDEKSAMKDGWLHTGDLGYIDSDSNLFITGRAKDLIIRSGHNIDPAMIEHCLEQHIGIELAAAVGWPDEYAGELPVAFVQLREGVNVSEQQLQEFVNDRIDERPACPKKIFILDKLPVTTVGKIHKPSLREKSTAAAIKELLNKKFVDKELTVKAAINSQGKYNVKVHTQAVDESFNKSCEHLSQKLGVIIETNASEA